MLHIFAYTDVCKLDAILYLRIYIIVPHPFTEPSLST